MPTSPNKLSQFWQELKRRKVVRVITVYAAAAFVILELISMVTEPFGLPEWTLKLVFVLLLVGFLIAIILSWIYNVHPEGGIVKTEPAHTVKEETTPPSSKGWKIASYVSFVVIVGLIVLNIIPRFNRGDRFGNLETSIAVLPLMNLSSNEDISSIGYTDDIIMELQKIKDFDRVLSLSSTSQFEEQRPTIPEIGRILNVNYLVEGTIQKQHDRISVNIQVIIAKDDDHLWGEEFEDVWENRFKLQDEIAFEVAKELHIILSPSEKERIEKIPTTSVTARDLYQRGRAEQEKYWLDNSNRGALERAEGFYHKALKYDSTFAQAYTGLALVYWNRQGQTTYLSENYLDSMLLFADIALSFDNQLAEAYVLRGFYYSQHNNKQQALVEYDKAINYNPNEWRAYWLKGNLFAWGDAYRALDNYHKAASVHRGSFLPTIYAGISSYFAAAGFYEKAKYYTNEALKQESDSTKYYSRLIVIEDYSGHFEKVLELCDKSLKMDSSNYQAFLMSAMAQRALGRHKESLENYKEFRKKNPVSRDSVIASTLNIAIGYAYLKNGYDNEGQYNLQKGVEYLDQFVRVGRHWRGQNILVFQGLTAGYANLGDTDRALDNLNVLAQIEGLPIWLITKFKVDPIFELMWEEPEFKRIINDLDDVYQGQYERVRQWLEENDML